MNKNYRIVWSTARQAYVVADEKARARGKSSTLRTVVTAAALLLPVASASAASLCGGGGATDVILDETAGCVLQENGSVTVTPAGSITTSEEAAVLVEEVSVDAIVNNGTLSSEYESPGQHGVIHIDMGTVNGGITNNASGVINGAQYAAAIRIENSEVLGGINNNGEITSSDTDAIVISGSSIDEINNSNIITGYDRGLSITDSSAIGSILNETNGSITGENYEGISIVDSTVKSITNRGTISGASGGIFIGFGSTISNPAGSVNNGDLVNEGQIEGLDGSYGIDINTGDTTKGVQGTLWNKSNGTITGISGVGIFSGTIGTLRNDGEIHGVAVDPGDNSYGIFLDGTDIVVGSIQNQGLIQGDLIGLGIQDGEVDSITNSGTIAGMMAGVGLSGEAIVSSALNNSGTISGAAFSVAVVPGVGAELSQINVTGDHAQFIGDIYAQDATITVKAGAVFGNTNAMGVKSFVVDSGATFNLGEGVSVSGPYAAFYGVPTLSNGIAVSDGFTNSGVTAVGAGVTGTIHGDYTQTATGTFMVGVSDDSTYGKLIVDGTASLPSNAKIVVKVSAADFVFNVDKLQGVLTANSLVSDGTFKVTDNSYLFDFGAVKNGDSVDLTLQAATVEPEQPQAPTARDSAIANGNNPAVNAATALDRIIANNPLSPVALHFVGLSDQQQVSNAVTQLLPLLTGASTKAASGALSSISRIIQARMDSNAGLSSGDGFLTDKHLWLKPFGSWADQDNRSGVAGYNADTMGFAIGSDAALNDKVRVGVAFAYAKADVDGASRIAPQSMDVDVYQLIGYGSYNLGSNTELNFQVDVGQNDNSGKRGIGFANLTAKSDYNSLSTHLGAGIGHTLSINDGITFTPSARLDYTAIRDEGYSEKGADDLNLKVSSNRTEELIASVDGKFNLKVTDTTAVALNLGAGYDVTDNRASITAAFAGEPGFGFTTYGINQNRWLLRSGIGLTHTADNGTEVSARYDNESRSGFSNQTASLKVRWAF